MELEVKSFIPYTLELKFDNYSDLKRAIQDRSGNHTEMNFSNALDNIQGDCKKTKGEDFSEVVLLALAYFYDKIYPRSDIYPIKVSYWNVSAVKGFFDALNLTPYTAIDELVGTYYPLNETALFNHCYLIIQTAYFFNAGEFGAHEYLTYTGHYTRTGQQLPIEEYKGNTGRLLKSYEKIKENKANGMFQVGNIEYFYTRQWYYSILYLVVKELGLSEKNFIVTSSRHREYNPVIKAPRVLRYETPFLLTHIDIKSAYPSFLDAITGSSVGGTIYERIAKAKGITREKAKVHFNMMLNSGRKDYWPKKIALTDLLAWGYTKEQAEHIITLTHGPGDKKFYDHMAEIEEGAILDFARTNSIDRHVRLHDAIIYIDSKKPNKEFTFQDGYVKFESEQPNKPTLNPAFQMSNRRLPYAYVSSMPNLKDLVKRKDPANKKLKGSANGFNFYFEKFEYYSTYFNLNHKYEELLFLDACRGMLESIYFLNSRKTTLNELEAIVRHIRAHSNICFQNKSMFLKLKNLNNEVTPKAEPKEKDWDATERKVFKTNKDFVDALNGSRMKVNQVFLIKNIKRLLIESLEIDKIEWIDFGLPTRNPNYKLASTIAKRLNYLRTNKKRKPQAQNPYGEPLYSNMYKGLRLSKIEPPKSKYTNTENIARRKVKAYERNLLNSYEHQKQLNANRELSEQYIFILDQIINDETDISIVINQTAIKQEKDFLIHQMKVDGFKNLVLIKSDKEVKPVKREDLIFNTDMKDSIFNNINEEQANSMGHLEDYNKFHNLNQRIPYVFIPAPLKKPITPIQKKLFE